MTASDACALLRLQLRPKRPMVRVCRKGEALLVCDASVPPEALHALGWTARRRGNCHWVDLPDPAYQALAASLPRPATDVWVEAWADCQALLADLARRSGPWRGASSIALLRDAMHAFSDSGAVADRAARAFLFRLRAEAAVALRSGGDEGVCAGARLAAHWLYRTHGVGLPKPPASFSRPALDSFFRSSGDLSAFVRLR